MRPTPGSVCNQVLSVCTGMEKGSPEVSDPSDTRKILINKTVPIKSV